MEKARTFGVNAKKIQVHFWFLHGETRKIKDFSEKMTLEGTFCLACSEKLNEGKNVNITNKNKRAYFSEMVPLRGFSCKSARGML